jgi:hypothetical protein
MATTTTTLVEQIRARLDDWDAEHDTTGCPGGPECIHTAAKALRAVLDLADRWEYGALRWTNPLPVPEEVHLIRREVAQALGLPVEEG